VITTATIPPDNGVLPAGSATAEARAKGQQSPRALAGISAAKAATTLPLHPELAMTLGLLVDARRERRLLENNAGSSVAA
jgi:hypothetical protein